MGGALAARSRDSPPASTTDGSAGASAPLPPPHLPSIGLLDLPEDFLTAVAAASLGAAAARRMATAPIGYERTLTQWGWVPPGDLPPPPSMAVVDAGVWAAAGAPLTETCRALAAAAYGGVRMLAVGTADGERRPGPLPGQGGDAAAATARSVAGFVRRCPALKTVAVAWGSTAPPQTVAAWEAPLLAALAEGGTVRSLVREGGGLTNGLVDGLRRLRLTSLAVSLGGVERRDDGDADEDGGRSDDDGGEDEVEDGGDASTDDGADDGEDGAGGDDGVDDADGESAGSNNDGGDDAVPEDDGEAGPGDGDGGGDGDGDDSDDAPDSDGGNADGDAATVDASTARHACLRRLLAAVAPTLTRLRLTGEDLPPAAWLGGDDAVALPSLQVLVYPVADFRVPLVHALGRACPSLCRLDARDSRASSNRCDAVDVAWGSWQIEPPQLRSEQLKALTHLPALEWLAAGPLHRPTVRGLAAALQRSGQPPLASLTLFDYGSEGPDTAAVGFGSAAGCLPAAIDVSEPLSVRAASALRRLPDADLERLSSLTICVYEAGVWAALAGLPVRTLHAAVGAAAVSGLTASHFPRLTSLTLQLGFGGGGAADLDLGALAAAAPAVVDLTLAVRASEGFPMDRIDEALTAFPSLTALTYTPECGRPGLRWLSAVAADARRRCTSRRTVRPIVWDHPVDPWHMPVAGGGLPGDPPPWDVVCPRERIHLFAPEKLEAYPTAEPMDDVDGIAAFASDFPGGWGGPPGGAPLPPGVAADVAFLRGWALPRIAYFGSIDSELYHFIAAPAAGRVACAAAAGGGGGGGGLLTGRQVLDDLRAGAAFAANPAVMGALDTVAPPCVQGLRDGADHLHTDPTKQSLMAYTGDEEEAVWAQQGVDGEADVVAHRAPHVAALDALRRHVVGGHLYCVSLHTERVEIGGDEVVGDDGVVLSTKASALVLNWVVGVSPDSGHLLGAFAVQPCHNLCD